MNSKLILPSFGSNIVKSLRESGETSSMFLTCEVEII